ncbi:MAG: DNA polymerase III subunit beta [Micrococcales bacterium]|nr:DNA polymerase III subunit beta [Micrococcales bacterium]
MKFRVERDVLAEAVSWVARGLPHRPPAPVLAGVHVVTTHEEGGCLGLSAFDYEVSAKVQISVDVEEPGEVLIPGKLLSEIAKALPSKPVEVVTEGQKVVITCGTAIFSLPCMALDDYPTLPAMPPVAGSIDASAFSEAVGQVATAATTDETLPLLTGVLMEFNGQHVTFLATDRYRLAIREVPWTPANPQFSTRALVRARTLREIAKTFSGTARVSLDLSEDAASDIVGFEADGRHTTTLLIDGDYPAIRKLLPAESPIEAVLSVPSLIEAVRRVVLVTDRNTPLHIAFVEGEATLTAGGSEEARAVEVIEAALSGEDIAVAFNPIYLAEGLAAVTTPYVRVSMSHPTKPVLFKGQNTVDGPADDSFQYLLVPIRFAS